MVVAAERFVKIQKAFMNQEEYIVMEWELLFTNYDYPTKDVNQVNIYLAKNIKRVSEQQS